MQKMDLYHVYKTTEQSFKLTTITCNASFTQNNFVTCNSGKQLDRYDLCAVNQTSNIVERYVVCNAQNHHYADQNGYIQAH